MLFVIASFFIGKHGDKVAYFIFMDDATTDTTQRSGTPANARLISRRRCDKKAVKTLLHVYTLVLIPFTERGLENMIEIEATLIKDARDVQAYFKQVKANTEQIIKNIELQGYRTLKLDNALLDIIDDAEAIIEATENEL